VEERWTKKPKTIVVEIGGVGYCKYCGKIPDLEEKIEKDDGDGRETARTCDCQGAQNFEKITQLQDEQTTFEHSANLILNPLRLREAISHLTYEIERNFPTK